MEGNWGLLSVEQHPDRRLLLSRMARARAQVKAMRQCFLSKRDVVIRTSWMP